MVHQERQASDAVKLWNDDSQYLIVRRRTDSQWSVRRYSTGIIGAGSDIGTYDSAQAAVEEARKYLQEGKDELDAALQD